MKIILTQPNYLSSGKRTYMYYPYQLGIINACIKDKYDSKIFDPNINNLSDEEIISYFEKEKPDVVGITSISTEYIHVNMHYTSLVKQAIPHTTIVQGGIIPTVAITLAMQDKNVNFWVIGEGEYSFQELLNALNNKSPYHIFKQIRGIAYYMGDTPIVTDSRPFIEDLDKVPFPDYGDVDIMVYANQKIKMGGPVKPRRNPYAFTITSRGCCYNCNFCSAPRVSGHKVRMRSTQNVLDEIDRMYKLGIRDILILDDHFLFNKKRAISIMDGIKRYNHELIWKVGNVTVWLLDKEIVDAMADSGCYQITISIESGSPYVLKNIIKKKAINLDKMPEIVKMVKDKGIEIISNWVIGFPHETWNQIRESMEYAENLNTDLVDIHIATPLPNTELREQCIKEGYLKEDFDYKENVGYTKANITTNEFTPFELHVVRAFEWDRINFKTEEKRKKIADMQGITLNELESWRKQTRMTLGIPTEEWGDYFKGVKI